MSLLIKRIPQVEIKTPPEENIEPLKHNTRELIYERLEHLKEIFSGLSSKIDCSATLGKTNYIGMGYLTAKARSQLIEMHFA